MSRLFTAVILSAQLLLASNSLALGFAPTHVQNWEKLYESAEDALDKNEYSRAELTIRGCLASTGASVYKQIFSLELLAELYEKQEKFSQEDEALRAMLVTMQSIDFPENLLGATYLKVGELNYLLKRYDVAALYAQQAIPSLEECYGSISPEIAVALNNLASAEYCQNKFEQAQRHFQHSLAILHSVYGNHNELYGMTALNLADVYRKMNNQKQSEVWYQKAATALRIARGSQDPDAMEAARRFSMSNKRTH